MLIDVPPEAIYAACTAIVGGFTLLTKRDHLRTENILREYKERLGIAEKHMTICDEDRARLSQIQLNQAKDLAKLKTVFMMANDACDIEDCEVCPSLTRVDLDKVLQ